MLGKQIFVTLRNLLFTVIFGVSKAGFSPKGSRARSDENEAYYSKIHRPDDAWSSSARLAILAQDLQETLQSWGAPPITVSGSFPTKSPGTSAYILAAREKTNSTNQYVFKVHPTGYYKLWEGVFNAPFGYYVEVGSQKRRFLPTEAVYLQLLSQCPRFPQLDSVYMHNDMTIIVMSAEAVVKRPERGHLCTENPLDHHFPSYSGDELIDGKTPRLTEIQVCKVATHILQALMYLMDMNMSHDDLSHRNYLVDENLNTTLIDLGFMHTAPSESGWKATFWIALLATEFLISPEIAQKLQSSAATDTPTTAGVVIYVRHAHDIRTQHMWKFGALIYDLLHGYAPWELPHWDPEIGALRDFHLYEKTEKRIQYIRDRRWRMINEDLPIDDRLSQDCVDVLRAMLAKDVAKRPALRELVSFPWFQGHWADYPAETFRRPPYLPREPTQGRRRRYSEQRS
ncbi:hypothetical protein PRK78_006603 [Emydomyces testavorans]|uniref:EKC/KEOPS complex subunit BUD32 n=1 Tax=Emydomyces testavorans TaxID=2070801 RepID=A0AAF0DMQ3_9EURO|nr:hypothetical protein PRK78_006603 [Emydomyces testavorans]